jgi:hypothetical protein
MGARSRILWPRDNPAGLARVIEAQPPVQALSATPDWMIK